MKASINLWLLAGWLVFVCAFIMPAYRLSGSNSPFPFGASTTIDNASQSKMPVTLSTPTLSGWNAMEGSFDNSGYPEASATTNLAIVLSVLGLFSKRFGSWLGWIVAAATFFNLWWLHVAPDEGGTLQVGYYTWVASFALVATGLLLRPRVQDQINPLSQSPV